MKTISQNRFTGMRKEVFCVVSKILLGTALAVGANSVFALPTTVSSVTPDSGSSVTTTDITVTGENFAAESKVSLSPGGIHKVSTIDVFNTNTWGGGAPAVFVTGNMLYAADEDEGLKAIDISNPENPTLVGGESTATAAGATDVEVVGDVAYMASSTGLRILDLSTLSTSGEATFVANYSEVQPKIIKANANYIYTVSGSTFKTLSASTQANPMPNLVGEHTIPYNIDSESDMQIVGNLAYIAVVNGVYIIDISNPQNPSYVGEYLTTSIFSIKDLAVNGNYLYLGGGDAMEVLDISNPALPSYVSEFAVFGDIQGARIQNDMLYISYWMPEHHGFAVLDLSDPTTPSYIKVFSIPGDNEGLEVSGNYAFIANKVHGVNIYDISQTESPTPLSISMESEGGVVAADGDYVYAVNQSGLEVIDFSNPSDPQIVGSNSNVTFSLQSGTQSDMALQGNILYTTNPITGLKLVDVANPSAPTVIGELMTGGDPSDVAVDGTTAYIADGLGGLKVMDVSDPNNITTLSVTTFAGEAVTQLTLSGSSLYIVTQENDQGYYLHSTLRVMDLSNPSQPVELGSIYIPYVYNSDLVNKNGFVFIASKYQMTVFDATNPAQISELNTINWEGGISPRVVIDGDFLYVGPTGATSGVGYNSSARGLINKIDISNPLEPTLVSEIETRGLYQGGVAKSGDYLITSADDVERHFEPLIQNVTVISDTTITATVSSGLPEGNYHLAVSNADSTGVDGALDNGYLVGATNPTGGADLFVSNIGSALSNFYRGQNVDFNVTVQNQGDTTANSIDIDLYLSTDAQIDSSDYLLDSANLTQLVAGDSASVTVNALIDMPTGNYYLGAIADSANTVTESNENNNVTAGSQVTALLSPKAEQVVTTLSVPSQIGLQGKFKVSATLSNLGSVSAIGVGNGHSYWAIYLSNDENITTSDHLMTTGSADSQAPDSSINFTRTLNLPSSYGTGPLYVGIITDYLDSVPEMDENNNSAVSQVEVVTSDIDLTISSSLYSNPYIMAVGGYTRLFSGVSNSGTSVASNVKINYYFSVDDVITTDDYLVGSEVLSSVGALSGNAIGEWVQANVPAGVYYLGAIADGDNTIIESNEDNNVRTGAMIMVTDN